MDNRFRVVDNTNQGWIAWGRQAVATFFNRFLARSQGADIYDDEKAEHRRRNTDGRTPLTAAIRSRDLEQVAALLKNPNVDVNFPEIEQYSNYSSVKQTPLCVATKLQDVDLVKLLLEAGASVDMNDSHGNPPLYYAAEKGNEECVSLLLKYKSRLSMNKHRHDPIHTACRNGHLGVVKLLEEAGCDLAPQKSSAIISPLGLAISHREEEIALYLLQNGFENKKASLESVGETLTQACWSGCDKLAKYLIESGIDVNKRSPVKISHFFYAIRSGHITYIARSGKACNGDESKLSETYDCFKTAFRESLNMVEILCDAGGLIEDSSLTPLCQTLKDFNIPTSIVLMKHGAVWDDTCDYVFERNRLRKIKSLDPNLYAAMVLLMDTKRVMFFETKPSRDTGAPSLPVPSLKQSCRRKIRLTIIRGRSEKKSIMPLIKTLPLPNLLLDYLCCTDIDVDQIVSNLTPSFFNHIISSL